MRSKAMKHPHPPPESQPNVQATTPKFPRTLTSSVTQVEPCETDLIAFLRESKVGIENDLARQKAQYFADGLDAVRHPAQHLH